MFASWALTRWQTPPDLSSPRLCPRLQSLESINAKTLGGPNRLHPGWATLGTNRRGGVKVLKILRSSQNHPAAASRVFAVSSQVGAFTSPVCFVTSPVRYMHSPI
uniref:Uncharacterized protein n=1 Tax=Sicyonia whispovirus TaxID=2984283 RepID=A0A9C7CG14_9VIRU|nr:MAG: hypothetical protein [Sicyonia whispovirus]